MKKVEVNQETCIGCGACVAIAPKNFDFTEEGLSTVISEEVDENTINACEACPVCAIAITETKDKKEEKEICECGSPCECGEECSCGSECTCVKEENSECQGLHEEDTPKEEKACACPHECCKKNENEKDE